MSFVRRIWNWCLRFRHRCGYGVHSPSDFFLITSVVYENLPYYAYAELKSMSVSRKLPHYRRKVNKLLFRLVNHFQPATLLEVGEGNGEAIRYMKAARPSMTSVSMTGMEKEETVRRLETALKKMEHVDFLHIGHTPYYKEVFEMVFPYLGQHSCVVFGNIYASEERKRWWKGFVEDERVRITFDLYDVGLALFDKKRHKQNFIVNFF